MKRFFTIIASATSLLLTLSPAKAQVTYVQGDFLLGFRASGGTGAGSNVLVDMGSSFLTSTTPFTFNLGNLGTVLGNTYGGTWFSRSDLFFSVAGADASSNSTIYITAPNTGSGATPWLGLGTSAQTGVRNKINTEGGLPNTSGYNFYAGQQTAGNPAIVEGQSDTNSYGSYMPGGTTANSGPAPGISYAQFNPTIEGTFANGTTGIKLDLIKLTSATGAGNAGQDLGFFQINNSGVLTWNPVAQVPEPSTTASLICGAGILFLAMRLRSSAKV